MRRPDRHRIGAVGTRLPAGRWIAIRIPILDPRISLELRGQRRDIVLGLACSAATALLASAMLWVINWVVTAVAEKDPTRLMQLSLLVLALFAVKYTFTRGQSYYLSRAGNRLTMDLRLRLFTKLNKLPISYFNQKRAGGLQSVLTNDVGVFQSAITMSKDAIDGPIKIVAGLVTAFAMQWKLALTAMLVLPLLAYVVRRNAVKMRQSQAQVQSDLSDMTAMMQESLQGVRVVKAFGGERTIVEQFRALAEATFQSQMVAARRIATLKPMVELIGAGAITLVVLVCAWIVQHGGVPVGHLAGFLFALDYVNQGMRNVGALRQTEAQVKAAADRIYAEVLDAPEPMVDAETARELPEFRGRIEFRDVSFAYPDGTEALRRVSFVIEPGSSLALVGASGAGKSTIADLILRFYDPTDGQILVDGVDLRELKISWWRAQLGVVPQQTFLFAGTIRDNLRLGRPDATESDFRDALDHAHAQFVNAMPNQLETELGERGVRLSGGEAQRIAIARAFIRRPKVLLLDEATSNLDSLSEKAVQEALDEIMVGRTTLMIAHRLSTAARTNHIVVLRRGEVLEQGGFRELVASDGIFAGMYRAYREGAMDEPIG